MSIIDNTIGGKCSNCGECCTEFIPLTKEEVDKIKKHLKHNPVKIQGHLTKNSIGVFCPFRDNINKRCTIYEVRPRVCRRFICNLSPKILEKNKTEGIQRAHYNGIKNFISLHALFFEDYAWELQFYYTHYNCESKQDLIDVLIKFKPMLGQEFIKILNKEEQ